MSPDRSLLSIPSPHISTRYMATLEPLRIISGGQSTNACLIILGVCTWLFSRWISLRPFNLPPGPKPDLFIGNLRQISFNSQELCFTEWGHTFGTMFCLSPLSRHIGDSKRNEIGDVVYFKIFGRPMIVLNTLKAARDLMEKRGLNYSCRPRFVLLIEM